MSNIVDLGVAALERDIKDLVISYRSYHAAMDRNDKDSTYVWAQILLGDQERLGVYMHKHEQLQQHIDSLKHGRKDQKHV
jgi:hypothetical protein